MSGFPLRFLRSAFGSILRDARPIEHPELEVSAARINLSEHVTAASSLILPRASLIAEYDGTNSQLRILHQEEAWNTDHAQAHPVLARGAPGQYSYTFASTYLDKDGIAQPFEALAMRMSVFSVAGITAVDANLAIYSSTIVTWALFDGIGDPSNGRFWLEVF